MQTWLILIACCHPPSLSSTIPALLMHMSIVWKRETAHLKQSKKIENKKYSEKADTSMSLIINCSKLKQRLNELRLYQNLEYSSLDRVDIVFISAQCLLHFIQWLLASHYSQTSSTLGLSNFGLGLFLDG